MAPVTYIELGDEPVVTEDWPDNSASVEGQTAEAAFGITGELATAKADDLATWAKAKADETTWSCDYSYDSARYYKITADE